jgi:hypothetical protein
LGRLLDGGDELLVNQLLNASHHYAAGFHGSAPELPAVLTAHMAAPSYPDYLVPLIRSIMPRCKASISHEVSFNFIPCYELINMCAIRWSR